MVRIGFVGLGDMGRAQAGAFAQVPGCKVLAGADPSQQARKKFQAMFPDAEVFENHQQLLEHPKIGAVVVAVPTGLHLAIGSDTLKAGKPLLLEKPMARTVAECRKLNRLADQTRTLLMIAHCRRYDPYWCSWAKFVRSGKLGSPILWRHVTAGRGPRQPWFMDDRLGGGPLLDGAVHNYDFANWVFGDPESVVSSSIKMDPHVTAVDTCSAVVRYRSGDQLLVSWSWSVRGCAVHDIIGPKGFIQFGTGDLTPPAQVSTKYNYCCFTSARGKQALIKSRRRPDMTVIQARHFLQCIQGKGQCQTPGTEAIKAVAVAQAILKAGPQGKARKVTW